MAYDLYVVTDEGLSGGLSHLEIAERVIAGGADVIQLRDKECKCRELLKTACAIREITRRSGTLFIVNDRLDVAIASEADGVHLGQDDIPVMVAKKMAPEDFIIGISVGDVNEAVRAEKGGADYIALSPTFNTDSKDDAGAGHGLSVLREIRSRVSIPLVAIGGIGCHNVKEVISAGADGVAVISAVVSQDDVTGAACELKALINASKPE